MNARKAPRLRSGLIGASLTIGLLVAAPPVASQVAGDDQHHWPRVPTPPVASQPVPPGVLHIHGPRLDARSLRLPESPQAYFDAVQPDDTAIRFVTSLFVTSIGSVAGLYGGAWAGVNSTDEYGGGWYSETTGAWVGAGIGTSVGAITASGLINGRWGRSVLGSLAGTAVGAFLGMAVDASYRSGVAGIATYGLTHGLITTVVAGS